MKQFEERHPQNVAINGRHALHAPMLGMLPQQSIQRFTLLRCSFEEQTGEGFNFRIKPLIGKKGLEDVLRAVSSKIPLEEHLQGEFARLSS